MEVGIFADPETITEISEFVKDAYKLNNKTPKFDYVLELSLFFTNISENKYNAIYVAKRGIDALEIIKIIKKINKDIPIVWISNDKFWGLYGYELNIAMFMTMPISDKKMQLAVRFCDEWIVRNTDDFILI